MPKDGKVGAVDAIEGQQPRSEAVAHVLGPTTPTFPKFKCNMRTAAVIQPRVRYLQTRGQRAGRGAVGKHSV